MQRFWIAVERASPTLEIGPDDLERHGCAYSATDVDERVDPGKPGGIFEAHLHRYRWAHGMVAGAQVLDAGCGEGYGAYLLASAAAGVLGIDISAPVVAEASRRYQHAGLRFAAMDCRRLAIRGAAFDVVVSFEVIEHLQDPHVYLAEISRILRRDGVVILSTPNHDIERFHAASPCHVSNPHHTSHFTPRSLTAVLTRHFQWVQVLGQRLCGHPAMNFLKWLDPWNLRHRLLSPGVKRQALGSLGLAEPRAQDFIISCTMIRQSGMLVAVCANGGASIWEERLAARLRGNV